MDPQNAISSPPLLSQLDYHLVSVNSTLALEWGWQQASKGDHPPITGGIMPISTRERSSTPLASLSNLRSLHSMVSLLIKQEAQCVARLATRHQTYVNSVFRIVALLACLIGASVDGQVDTGRILGTVKDQSGAVVPNASIVITKEGTSTVVQLKTNESGTYQSPPLSPGSYSVQASSNGFQAIRQEHAILAVQQQAVIDFSMTPGSVTTAVDVIAQPEILQTQDASIGNVVQTKQINDLPLNGRNYTFLAQLNAGVTVAQADGRGLAASGTFDANGTSAEQNNYLLDGINNNSNLVDYLNGTSYQYRPSIDSLQEFKLQTGNFSAEFGRSAGAVLNAVTKAGTNELHGDVFEFLRNDALDASNFFENAGQVSKGKYRQNQFGFTLGGPLVIPHLYNGKNKSFFFVDYEGTRIRQANPYTGTVPTAAERDSNYTNLGELLSDQTGSRTDLLGRTYGLGQVFDPATTRTVTAGQRDPVTGRVALANGFLRDPFPNNQLSLNRLDPNAIKLLNAYPIPTRSGLTNNFVTDPVVRDDTNQGDVRLDQNFGVKDLAFARYSTSQEPSYSPPPFPGVADGGQFGNGEQLVISHNGVLSETHTFSSSLVNEARAGYGRIQVTRLQANGDNLNNLPAQFGIQGIPQVSQNGGMPTINISGLSTFGSAAWLPSSESNTNVQLSDNLTKIAGQHSLKGGFQYVHSYLVFYQPSFSRGQFNFSGVYTEVANTSGGNTGLAQLLLSPKASSVVGGFNNVGGADYTSASNMETPKFAQNYYAGYLQDDWKVSQKLTLNLGLRYEYMQHGVETQGMAANFLQAQSGASADYMMTKSHCRQGLSPSFLQLAAKDNIAITCSDSSTLVLPNKNNWAPRFGAAYHALDKLVVRTGFGLFYGVTYNGDVVNTGNNYPYQYMFNNNYPDPGHPITYSNGSIATLENGLSAYQFDSTIVNAAGLSLQGHPRILKAPYAMEFNFSLQYQLSGSQTVTAGYVGTQSRRLFVVTNDNAIGQLLPPGVNAQNYVPFPDFGRNAQARSDIGNSHYNALQLSYQRRFSNGFDLLANYTRSQCRTDARSILTSSIGYYRAPALPGFGIAGDYSLCDFDVPQVFHASGGYTLPVGRGQRFLPNASGVLSQLVTGWRINAIATVQNGQPFTVNCSGASTTSGLGCYALLVPGQDRYAGPHNVNQWLNPAAFATPAAATTIGQSDYGPLGGAPTQGRGPSYRRIDLSLFKQFPIRDTIRLEFRTEAFNLTNTPQFANPSFLDYTNTSTFGRITSTRDGANDPREIQFALKFYW